MSYLKFGEKTYKTETALKGVITRTKNNIGFKNQLNINIVNKQNIINNKNAILINVKNGLRQLNRVKKNRDIERIERIELLKDEIKKLTKDIKNNNKELNNLNKKLDVIVKLEDNLKVYNDTVLKLNTVKYIKIKPPTEDDEMLINEKNLRKLIKKNRGQTVIIEYVLSSKQFNKILNSFEDDYDDLGFLITKEVKRENFINQFGQERILTSYSIKNITYTVPENRNDFDDWWAIRRRGWWVNSGTHYFEIMLFQGKVFSYPEVFEDQDENIKEKIVQYFKDGITHCVFTPIKEWAIDCLENSKSVRAKSRYDNILKDIDIYNEKYKNGINELELNEVCNKLQIDITIDLPFCEKHFIECKTIKKKLKAFKFMNSRLNHVDLNKITSMNEVTKISRGELLDIQKTLDKTKEFYTFTRDFENINSISTLSKCYRFDNEFGDVCNKFEIDNGLNYCKIDDIDDKELSSFINKGTNYNGTIDFIDTNKINANDINHIDMKRAYANFKKCSVYQGFLGKITDFRLTNKIMGIGLYRVSLFDFSNVKQKDFIKYNEILKIYENNNVYTSPELLFLSSFGIKYTIICGCWGIKPLEFEFNDEMMKDRINEPKYYAKWAGLCDSHKLYKKFNIKCKREYYNLLKDYTSDYNGNEPICKWFENNEAQICYPKKHNFHLGHITAFITSYQRISVLEQLFEIDYKNVIRVCVDGIYHKQEKVNLKNVFRVKNDNKNFTNEPSLKYCNNINKYSGIINNNLPIFRENYSKELHLGEGGCGKTHYNCNDKGLIKVLFLAPSWKLASIKKKETNINCNVWANALTDDVEKIKMIKEKFNVLIIDEVSMLTNNQKKQYFKLYGDMKLIFCGDLGYQLMSIIGEEMNKNEFDNIVNHDTDYRCKDIKLKEIKNILRKMIKERKTKDEINKFLKIKFRELNKFVSITELKEKYKIEDMILTGNNIFKDYFTSLFSGKFNKEKYYITENNRLYSNGEIIISEAKPENIRSEIRHSFTTHSIQGETAHKNLYIDINNMFDPRMAYTAISRAKTLEQIFFIEHDKDKFKELQNEQFNKNKIILDEKK